MSFPCLHENLCAYSSNDLNLTCGCVVKHRINQPKSVLQFQGCELYGSRCWITIPGELQGCSLVHSEATQARQPARYPFYVWNLQANALNIIQSSKISRIYSIMVTWNCIFFLITCLTLQYYFSSLMLSFFNIRSFTIKISFVYCCIYLWKVVSFLIGFSWHADLSILELYILVCMNRLEIKEHNSYNFSSIMKGQSLISFVRYYFPKIYRLFWKRVSDKTDCLCGWYWLWQNMDLFKMLIRLRTIMHIVFAWGCVFPYKSLLVLCDNDVKRSPPPLNCILAMYCRLLNIF